MSCRWAGNIRIPKDSFDAWLQPGNLIREGKQYGLILQARQLLQRPVHYEDEHGKAATNGRHHYQKGRQRTEEQIEHELAAGALHDPSSVTVAEFQMVGCPNGAANANGHPKPTNPTFPPFRPYYPLYRRNGVQKKLKNPTTLENLYTTKKAETPCAVRISREEAEGLTESRSSSSFQHHAKEVHRLRMGTAFHLP